MTDDEIEAAKGQIVAEEAQRRVDDPRINKLVADVCDLKTQMAENTEITHQVRDILTSFRVMALFAKWIAAIAAAVAGVVAAWQSFKS